MRDLKTFQKKIEAYRKNAPTPHTQKELAEAIPLDKDEFSKRLNAYKHPNRNTSPLTCAQVQAIVRVLTRWGAIETQEQAKDLLDLMECPYFSISDWNAHPLNLLRAVPPPLPPIQGPTGITETQRKAERLARLRAMQVDHSGFLHNRLESFVGRQTELADLQQLIIAMLPKGGYITITGQAGQGKSSIIAKLVDEWGPNKTAHHFIPFNPGPDYQVNLLRDLMARLIMKHGLPDLYVASESRPALRDYFPKVLAEIAAKGKQEVIFIDGLDQLLEDQHGERDLSFLPNNLPGGVVFVLGTRPNDTLRPLELRKPYYKYDLPNMSRQDFNLILEHRGVTLDNLLIDQFYQALQENALYLDLVAKELAQEGTAKPEEVIRRVADNPENIFSLSIARLKRIPVEWREVLKPILGVLLVAREPLTLRNIRQILDIDDDRIREDLARLGGLIANDGRDRYSLFHRKLYDYLRQDENNPHKEYIFATDEEEGYHKMLADWCEKGGLPTIWEDVKHDPAEQARREYARQHYITHLYYSLDWLKLFHVLNEGAYGRAKVRYDVSTRLYALDLDRGRQAAAWKGWKLKEGIERLPSLWRYTLLRCSLASRADKYPLAAFRLLVILKREQEAMGLAELVSDPTGRVAALCEIAEQMGEAPGREQERLQVLLRASEIAHRIEAEKIRASSLYELGLALAQAGEPMRANIAVNAIEASDMRDYALEELGILLAESGEWRWAGTVIRSIDQRWRRARALIKLSAALEQVQLYKDAPAVWAEAKSEVLDIGESMEKVLVLSELGGALFKAQHWEEAEVTWAEAEAIAHTMEKTDDKTQALSSLGVALTQARKWDRAETIMRMIDQSDERARVLSRLGQELVQAGEQERAEAIWCEIEATIRNIEKELDREQALERLSWALARAGEWKRAEEITYTIERPGRPWALESLCDVLSQEKQWERAEAVIRDIDQSEPKVRALSKLGVALAKIQEWEKAQAVWAEAEEIIRTVEEDWQRSEALGALGEALVEMQEWEKAEMLIRAIEKSYIKAEVLIELGNALLSAQQTERADTVWTEAKRVIQTIDEPWQRARMLGKFGAVLVQVQQQERAAQMWDEAELVIRGIEKGWERVQALSGLGEILMRAQQRERANAIWAEVEAEIHTIEEDDDRALALEILGKALARAGEWERAEEIVGMIETGYEGSRAWVLSELGKSLTQRRLQERAEEMWIKAEAEISAIVERDEKDEALKEMAWALAEAGEWQRAEAVINNIGNSSDKGNALWVLGKELAHAKELERAEAVLQMIEEDEWRAWVLVEYSKALAKTNQHERLLHIVQDWWQQVHTSVYAIRLLPMVTGLLPFKPEISMALCESFTWLDAFLKG